MYSRFRWPWVFLGLFGITLLLALLLFQPGTPPGGKANRANAAGTFVEFEQQSAAQPRLRAALPPVPTAEEIVAGKLAKFAKSRRELAKALARRHKVEVPQDVDAFFAAVASGNWEEIEAAYKKLNGGDPAQATQTGLRE